MLSGEVFIVFSTEHARRARLRLVPFFLRYSRASETRTHVKITPREKGETRWITRSLQTSHLLFSSRNDFGCFIRILPSEFHFGGLVKSSSFSLHRWYLVVERYWSAPWNKCPVVLVLPASWQLQLARLSSSVCHWKLAHSGRLVTGQTSPCGHLAGEKKPSAGPRDSRPTRPRLWDYQCLYIAIWGNILIFLAIGLHLQSHIHEVELVDVHWRLLESGWFWKRWLFLCCSCCDSNWVFTAAI